MAEQMALASPKFRDIYVQSLKTILSVTDYYTEIKKLWDDYNAITKIPHCSCGFECASLKAMHKMIDR